jgi:hypothetical protein
MAAALVPVFTAFGANAATLATVGTVGSILSGVSTAASVFGQISGGGQQAAIAKAQAQQYELAAKQEELRGREQADNIRRSLQSSLASQRAIFGARGISLNSGTPRILSAESSNAASRDIDTARFNAGQSAFALRSQGAQARIEGKAAKMGGYMGGLKTIGGTIL